MFILKYTNQGLFYLKSDLSAVFFLDYLARFVRAQIDISSECSPHLWVPIKPYAFNLTTCTFIQYIWYGF
ncbi:hypothetical protein AC812_07300 [Bellilinea caldifistulae]|uniref:Uncharacterized protein n=1 Tax=Bellilinea caldifistulae TaxID=360411 RepID=A0A0P6X4F5_9CHLR|nr:hypothetical protein AC812_07300 [Bellilinea caldifistulae]